MVKEIGFRKNIKCMFLLLAFFVFLPLAETVAVLCQDSGPVNRVTFTGNTITAFDSNNNRLWDYSARSTVTKALVADVNNDCINEVVFGTGRDGTDKGVLYVINASGQRLWSYKTGATDVFWTDDQMTIIAIRVGDVDNDGSVEIVTLSYHYYWFPERLCVLNGETGVLKGDYWNPGKAASDDSLLVEDLDGDGIAEIIVGSGNNDAGNVAAVYRLEGNNISGQAQPYYGNGTNGTEIWYANLGRPVNEAYPYVGWVESTTGDVTGDGVTDLRCGGGTKNSPTYVICINGNSGQQITTSALTVNKTGAGSGTVTHSVGNINCDSSSCTEAYCTGTSVTLTVTPNADSSFAGWSGGGCWGTGTCTVTVNEAQTITATFNLRECSYNINPTEIILPSSGGTGSIDVTGSSSACTGSWTATTTDSWITVASGSSGSGNGTVDYSVSSIQTSSARIGTITVAGQSVTVLQSGVGQFFLSVSKEGTGTGTVTSSPSGVSCGSDCEEAYTQNSFVTLTAAPAAGSIFEGWSRGGCSGADPCTVTLSSDITVTARFSRTRSVKLAPQVLMAGFDPILLDFATTRLRVTALVREGNQPIGSVSITDNTGSLTFAMNLIGSLSNGDLLYGTELSISRGEEFSLPNIFGSDPGQILIRAVDTAGLNHSFPTIIYGSNPDITANQDQTDAEPFTQRGCKRLFPQVMMAGLEPTLLDFDDTEIKVRAMVREGARPIQDVSLKLNNSSFNLAMDLVETLANGDRLYEKAIVFSRGSFGYIESDFENLWGSGNGQFKIEVRDDAGQRHSFPDVRRGDYRTINANECWSDQ